MTENIAKETATPVPGGRRLESWKEIASYLGRDVRTVQRWEAREGLPVRRQQHLKLGSAFAFTAELDAWRESKEARTPETLRPGPEEPPPDTRGTLPGQARAFHRAALPAAAAAVLLVAAIPLIGITWRPASTGGTFAVGSLAVLPLEDRSQPASDEYFADGVTEALIGRLSSVAGVAGVRIISRPSIMQFKGSTRPIPEIAAALDVDAVVAGSVSRAGDRVSIEAELVRGDTGEVLWSGSYDRIITDMLSLESEIAGVVASQILARARRPAPAPSPRPVAADVYDTYLRARFLLNSPARSRAKLEESVRLFTAAVEGDPTFAAAHAGLAQAYHALGSTSGGAQPNVSIGPKVVAAATRAVQLEPDLAEAHGLLALTHQQAHEWAEAEARYRRALDLDPNDAGLHLDYGGLLMWTGRTDEGVAYARRGRELDPLTAGRTVSLAWILYHARRYEEAIAELRGVLAAQPDHRSALWFLGFNLIDAGRPEEAIATLERLAVIWERNPAGLGVLARAYARAGRTADADAVIEELERRAASGYVPAAVFVNAYSAVDADRAMAALERAYAERSNIVQCLKTHPAYDPLRSDPRFVEMLRRTHLD